jgi:hypothetical protein
VKIPPDLRDEAAEWCAVLAYDRGQPAWSIRLTNAEIESSQATQVAWRAYCAAKERLGRDAPPQILWAEAEASLRTGWTDRTPEVKIPVPIRDQKPTPTRDKLRVKKKEQRRMAKKQSRRSISVSRKAYERAKAFAAEKGVSLAQLTEAALAHAIEQFYQSDGDR